MGILSTLFLLLPVAAATGWYAGYRQQHAERSPHPSSRKNQIPRDYLIGLNYIINEQPDKAVDVFIKMLEVNTDTIETHLALGSLFRRRGEVDRAIRVHQNIIARPQLTTEQRSRALSELGQDYLRAGVLDRAENLFLELVGLGAETLSSNNYLLNIYQLQKDWKQAITIAKKLETGNGVKMRIAIAHYNCELAEQALQANDLNLAQDYLKKAISTDKNCVRANLIFGNLAMRKNDYATAIRHYKQVKKQEPDYISEVLPQLATCYEKLNQPEDYQDYLQGCLKERHRISVILAMAEYIKKNQGEAKTIEFLAKAIHKHLSLRGASYLLSLYIKGARGDTKTDLLLLQNFLSKLQENSPNYRCLQCGFAGKLFYWQCPSCLKWSTVRPIEG
jgi:lipopolysaccharide assembly protein B